LFETVNDVLGTSSIPIHATGCSNIMITTNGDAVTERQANISSASIPS
jgi:hypothetical protein